MFDCVFSGNESQFTVTVTKLVTIGNVKWIFHVDLRELSLAAHVGKAGGEGIVMFTVETVHVGQSE